MRPTAILHSIFAICTFSTVLLHSSLGCLTPDSASILVLQSTNTQLSVYQGFLDYAQTTVDAPLGIFNYTAPKQVRTWTGVMSVSYTAMAWHENDSNDFLSRDRESDIYRRCRPQNAAQELLIEQHARETFAYAYLWAIQEFVPEWTQLTIDYASSTLNLDLSTCFDEDAFGCGEDTPYGLARFIVRQYRTYMKYDGWNADASYSFEEYKWQYQEFRNSDDYSNPEDACKNVWKWRSESCALFDLGYFKDVCWTPQQFQFHDVIYYEKYLMQHVAITGRSYFLGDDYICNEKTQYPCYDLLDESNNAISRWSAIDDDEKAEIEFFDNVFGWYSEINKVYWASSTLTQFEIITGLTAAIASMYEATLLVWKDKWRHGVIRPRTYINKNLPDSNKGWKPYTMDNPTPEYPSHVSCMCTAYTRAMRKFANEVGDINPDLLITLAAGSSKIEENEPTNDVLLYFENWKEILDKCNDSRLNGGNHFSKSASEAEQLCGPVGPKVVEAFDKIVLGIQPSYTIDYNLPIYLQRCPDQILFGAITFDRKQYEDPTGAKAIALAALRSSSYRSKNKNAGSKRGVLNGAKKKNKVDGAKKKNKVAGAKKKNKVAASKRKSEILWNLKSGKVPGKVPRGERNQNKVDGAEKKNKVAASEQKSEILWNPKSGKVPRGERNQNKVDGEVDGAEKKNKVAASEQKSEVLWNPKSGKVPRGERNRNKGAQRRRKKSE